MPPLPRSPGPRQRPTFPQFAFEVRFAYAGTPFSALNAAERWLTARDYRRGAIERDNPIGIHAGEASVGKWSTLTLAARALLDGVIDLETPEFGYREGSVIIRLRKDPARVTPPSSRRGLASAGELVGALALRGRAA